MDVETTDFLVDLADINRTKTRLSRCSTSEGDVLVRIEQFAFTANNMTYCPDRGFNRVVLGFFFQRHEGGVGVNP